MSRAPTTGSEPTLAIDAPGAAHTRRGGAEPTLVAGDDAQGPITARPRAEEPLAPGARLGRYVLAGPLGEGGMGTVYAAHDPDLDRKVAIKVLHARLAAQDGTSGDQRLLREAQAMARLSHPNVVAIHDVGVVGTRLFIAMELIDGCDLRRWLAEQRRSWRAIVEVFMAAGAGLAAAHDAGIIHRDFKPDNVLIARNGRVLVGDFGLAASAVTAAVDSASVTRSWLGEAGSLTLPGALMGTPAYMAPEQMAGAEITPAADIFAFCVALYEAVYGQRPFRGDSVANLFLAIQDQVIGAPAGVKVPRRLTRALRRGLAAEPADRQPSMHALLAELRPIVAARRLWLGGAALGLVAVSASAALWLGADDEALCSGGEAAVAAVWSPERRSALVAAFVETKVVHAADTFALVSGDIDRVADAWIRARRDACEATQVRGEQSTEVLDRRMSCLDRQLADLDQLLTFLGQPDAKIVDNAVSLVLDLPAPAQCDASALLSTVARPTPLEAPERVAIDRQISHANMLHRVGQFAPAVAELEALLVRARALGDPMLLSRALTARAQAGYVDSDEHVQEWTTQALEHALRVGDDARFAEIAANQVALAGADGPNRELWLRLGEAAIVRHGGSDELRAKLLGNYGNALRRMGELKRAGAAQYEALELRRRHPEAPTLIADALLNLSAVLAAEERFDETLPLANEAIEIWTRELGPSHPRMITALSNLAVLAMRDADYPRAHDFANRSLDLVRRLRGPDHPDYAHQLAIVATIEGWRGDLDAAVQHFDRVLEIYAAAGPARRDRYAEALLTAASFQTDARDLNGAEAALELLQQVTGEYPPDHPMWVTEATSRIQIALARDDLAEVARQLERAHALLARTETPESLGDISVAMVEAELDLRRGKFAESHALLQPLAARFPRELKHPFTRGHLRFLEARVAWAQGRHAEARTLAVEAQGSFARLGRGFAPRKTEVDAWLAEHPAD